MLLLYCIDYYIHDWYMHMLWIHFKFKIWLSFHGFSGFPLPTYLNSQGCFFWGGDGVNTNLKSILSASHTRNSSNLNLADITYHFLSNHAFYENLHSRVQLGNIHRSSLFWFFCCFFWGGVVTRHILRNPTPLLPQDPYVGYYYSINLFILPQLPFIFLTIITDMEKYGNPLSETESHIKSWSAD